MANSLPQSAIRAVFAAVTSHAQSLGVIRHTTQHEPMSTPGQGISCAVILGPIKVISSSGLAAASGRVDFLARVYNPLIVVADAVAPAQMDNIDPDILDAVSQLLAAYCGDLTLALGAVPAGLVRSVDVHGQHGAPLGAQPGYLHQDGKVFRTMDATIGLILNDIWGEAIA